MSSLKARRAVSRRPVTPGFVEVHRSDVLLAVGVARADERVRRRRYLAGPTDERKRLWRRSLGLLERLEKISGA